MKNHLIRIAVCLIFCFQNLIAFSQIAISADPVGGQPLMGKLYPDIVGTPYLLEDWTKANVILKNGKVWHDLDLKVDLYAKRVIFKDQKEQEKLIIEPLSAIVFHDSQQPRITILDKNVFQNLVGGPKVAFLKNIYKVVNETKEYNTSRTEKKFILNADYFVLAPNGNLKKIKLTKASILENLPQYKGQLETIIGNQKLKKAEDFVPIFEALNNQLTNLK